MNNYEGKRLFGSWYIPDFQKPIGVGSFGTVYELRSYDVQSGVTAVKIISIPKNEADYMAKCSSGMSEDEVKEQFEKTKDNLIQEIEMMLKVSGFTNCVGCMTYAVEPHEDCFGWDILIQMEKLESLNEYYKSKRSVTNLDIVRLGIDICSALEVCQTNNIVHRDIKPQNIMVKNINGKAFYKLGDFGVARTLSVSGTMTMSGTLDYMAPELLQAKGDLRVDIYSMGLVMYKLLNANRAPFMPDYPNEIAKGAEDMARQKRFNGEKMPEPLYAIGTNLAKVVLKACEFDAEERYASASEMKKDLEKALAEEKEWPVFSVTEVGKYVPSERKAIVKIHGNHETVSYDGKEHSVAGYSTNISNGNIKVELCPGVTAAARGTKAGRYSMGLSKDSFAISSNDANLSIEEVIVEDGYVEIENVKSGKSKWIIGGIALAFVVIICALLFGGKKERPVESPALPVESPAEAEGTDEAESGEESIQVILHLTPDETAGFADVNHDTPIMIERLKHFTDEKNISVSEETGEIEATIPLENLGASNDLISVIRGTINRPLELYFVKQELFVFYHNEESLIDRSDVLSAEVITAKEAEQLYGFSLEHTDQYASKIILSSQQPCIKLELTDAGMARIHALDDQEGDIAIMLDATIEEPLHYPIIQIEEDKNTIILCASSWKEDTIAEAQADAFMSPPLNCGYTFSAELSADAYWENIEEVDKPGELQCNYEDITGDTLRINYKTYKSQEEVTEEEYESVLREFKRRLDIVGVPYAIGRGIQNSRDIVVYTSPAPYNVILMGILCDSSLNMDFKVNSSEVETWNLEAEAVELVQYPDSGNYALRVNFTLPDALQTITSKLFKYSSDRHVYIGDYDSMFASATVDKVITDGQLDFDAIPMAQQDSVDEAHKYILELMERIFDDEYMPNYYSLDNYTLSEGASFGLSALPEEDLAIPDLIEEKYEGTEAWIREDTTANLYIKLHTETKSGFLQEAFTLTEQIYKEFDLDNCSFDSIYFVIIDETEDTRCRIFFNPPYQDSRYKDCGGMCFGDWLDTYTEEFENEGKTRSFFKNHNFGLWTLG